MKTIQLDVTRIELEPGDEAGDLYEELGEFSGGEKIAIVNGAIHIEEPR